MGVIITIAVAVIIVLSIISLFWGFIVHNFKWLVPVLLLGFFAYGALTDEKGDFEFFIVMLCIWGVISVGVTIAQRKQIETLENQIDNMRKELDELRSKTIQGKVTNAIADTAIGVMKDAVTDVLFR